MKNRFRLGRPSPAFALASVALFVALGGTGYAATHVSNSSKPLTTKKVETLIKQYVSSHSSTIPVVWRGSSSSGVTNHTIHVGPWSVKMQCNDIAGHQGAGLAVVGPGDLAAESVLAGTNGSAGDTYEGEGPTSGGGVGVSPGGQFSQIDFLNHGSTIYQLIYNMQATTAGAATDCIVLGDAIKIP